MPHPTPTLAPILLTASILALALGACGPTGPTGPDPQRLVLLGRDIVHGQDAITPERLADWLIQDRRDVLLLDLRPRRAYRDGHIQGAESVPLTYLFEAGTIDGLPANRTLLLYSDTERAAAQATAVLRLAGRDARLLEGGYQGWQDRVLAPRQIPGEAAEATAKRLALACYFSGNYKGQGEGRGAAYTPLLTPVTPGAKANIEKLVRPRRHSIREEGC